MLKILEENKNDVLLRISKSLLLSLGVDSFSNNKIETVNPEKDEIIAIKKYKKNKSSNIKLEDFIKKYDW